MSFAVWYEDCMKIHSFVNIQQNMWLMKLISRLQPCVILALFMAFLLIFGLPAYDKYTSYEVYIKESVIDVVEGMNSPAMTICVDMVRHKTRQSIHISGSDCLTYAHILQ